MCFIISSLMVSGLSAGGWLGSELCDDVSAGLTTLVGKLAIDMVWFFPPVGLDNNSQGL